MSFVNSQQKQRMVKPALAIVIVILAIGAAVVYALFSQTIPSVTVPAQFGLTPCTGSLVAENSPTPGSGTILFDCGAGTHAFTVSNGPGTVTPSWKPIPTNPTGITVSLGITSGVSCSASTTLTNNTQISLTTGSYDYCLGYSGVPSSGGTVGPVTISWAP